MTPQTKAQNRTPPHPVRSVTLVHLMPGDFDDAELKDFRPADARDGALEAAAGSSRPVAAILISPPIGTAFPFDQLLAGANASLGPRERLELAVQVKNGDGWSPWFEFGGFGTSGDSASVKDQRNAFGRMETDVLALSAKVRYLRYRVTLKVAPGSKAFLRLVSVTYTDTSVPYDEARAAGKPAAFRPVRLDVPRHSQMLQQVNFSKDICSPTSLTMVLNHFGLNAGVLETAAGVRDAAENIYGNWTFNTMYAGTKGLYAWPARFDSLEEAGLYLAAGIPLVASVTFGPDELKKAPLKKTRGHLLVVKGFNSAGNVLVNDPAAPEEKTIERVYDRKEFSAAWLKNKFGLAYIVTPLERLPLTARPPLAELFSAPPDRADKDRSSLVESQLLPLEALTCGGASGAWLKISAAEQAHREKEGKVFGPYAGWIGSGTAAYRPLYEPDAVVRSKKAALLGGPVAELSIGARVRVLAREKNGLARILLPGGGDALIGEHDLNFLPVRIGRDDLRKKILETARQFLGDRYYWGGRSGYGVDCSGLVNLAYRVWGVDLPRNASDQFEFARAAAGGGLKPADLIFSSEKCDPVCITHVMLYAGGEKLLEATQDTGTVREVTFREKFGLDFAKAKNGRLVNGKKVYFRTVFKTGG